MFVQLHCYYPTTAIISVAKNNLTRIYMKLLKTALPLEGMLCPVWFSLRLEDPQPQDIRTATQSPVHGDGEAAATKASFPTQWLLSHGKNVNHRNKILM